ncbi:MAG: hypothetical protein WCB68_14550 [Pyrinomonadaceae bacterium]
MYFKRLTLALTIALLLSSSIAAQSASAQDSPAKGEPPKVKSDFQEKAASLLEEVATEAQGLKLPENRIRIKATVADMLWERDEKRARALFKEATDALVELIGNIDPADPNYYQLLQAPSQLRQIMQQMLPRRDARLALEFLRATRLPQQPQAETGYKQADYELQLEINLIEQISREDPRLALQLAEESLSKGVSASLDSILINISEKDREGAARLLSEIIKKLQSENLLRNQEAASVAVSLLNQLHTNHTFMPNADSDKGERPIADAQAVRDLMELVLTAAVNSSADADQSRWMERSIAQTLLSGLKPLMPQIEKFSPSRAAQLVRKQAQFNRTLDARSRFWQENAELLQKGSIEEMLDLASKAPPEMRSEMIQQAAGRALSEGNVERARQIINDNISNATLRQQMIANIDSQLFWQKSNEGKLAEAHQLLARLRGVDRATMLVHLGTVAAGKNDKTGATQFLEEAWAMVGQKPENYNQLQVQINIAGAYNSFAPERSFGILEGLAGQLNEMLSAAEVLNGFEQEYYKQGELLSSSSNLSSIIDGYDSELASLAQIDFERAKNIAGSFQRTEVRVMAELRIAQEILSGAAELPVSRRRFRNTRTLNRSGN